MRELSTLRSSRRKPGPSALAEGSSHKLGQAHSKRTVPHQDWVPASAGMSEFEMSERFGMSGCEHV